MNCDRQEELKISCIQRKVLASWLQNSLMVKRLNDILLFQIDDNLLEEWVAKDANRDVLMISKQLDEVFEQLFSQFKV